MDQINKKLDKIIDVQGEQAVTLARLTVSVEEHVRRTNILEDDMGPIKDHVSMVNGALKLIGVLGILAGIAEAIILLVK